MVITFLACKPVRISQEAKRSHGQRRSRYGHHHLFWPASSNLAEGKEGAVVIIIVTVTVTVAVRRGIVFIKGA